jgi:hypothetical protein
VGTGFGFVQLAVVWCGVVVVVLVLVLSGEKSGF